MLQLSRAQFTELVTSAAPAGNTIGTTLDYSTLRFNPSLQVDHLSADTYTVQFSIIPPAPIPSFGQTVNTLAIVRWKVQGQQMQRVVSVVNGTSISGLAEAVDVQVADYSGFMTNAFGGPVNPPGRSYKVAASLTKGIRAATLVPPSLALSPGAVVPGVGLANFPVPPDAGVNCFYVTSVSQGNTTIDLQDIIVSQFYGSTNNFAASYPLAVDGNGWTPLFPGATNLSITTRDAAGTFMNVIWGIDG